MRPATVQHLLVFGVCGLGVFALYAVPSLTRTGDQPRATRLDPAASLDTARQRTAAGRPSSASTRVSAGAVLVPEITGASGRTDRPGDRATPYDPRRHDRQAPTSVSGLRMAAATHTRLTLRWAAATDDTGIAAYRVSLNGFDVATTSRLEITVPWFNTDAGPQIVQVRALDAAGNQSALAATALVSRPEPEPPVGVESAAPDGGASTDGTHGTDSATPVAPDPGSSAGPADPAGPSGASPTTGTATGGGVGGGAESAPAPSGTPAAASPSPGGS